MSCDKFKRDVRPLDRVEMEHRPTRQLLKELRDTYRAWDYDWNSEDEAALHEYRATLKAVLATREHIPNKQESKAIRKAKKKRGQ